MCAKNILGTGPCCAKVLDHPVRARPTTDFKLASFLSRLRAPFGGVRFLCFDDAWWDRVLRILVNSCFLRPAPRAVGALSAA